MGTRMPKSPYEDRMDVICPECETPVTIANRLSDDGVLIVKEHVIGGYECPGGGKEITGVPDF